MQVFWQYAGAGFFAAVAAIVTPVIVEKIKHRHKTEDAVIDTSAQIELIRDDIRDYQEETRQQIDELKAHTEERMERLESKVSEIASTTDAIVKNEIARTYVQIRQQALYAIKNNKIKASDKERLMAEYKRYKKLPSANGFLDDIMSKVNELRIIVEDDDLE